MVKSADKHADRREVDAMNETGEFLKKLETARFYGSVEVKFEAGIPTLIRKTETFKPTEKHYRANGSDNEQTRKQ